MANVESHLHDEKWDYYPYLLVGNAIEAGKTVFPIYLP